MRPMVYPTQPFLPEQVGAVLSLAPNGLAELCPTGECHAQYRKRSWLDNGSLAFKAEQARIQSEWWSLFPKRWRDQVDCQKSPGICDAGHPEGFSQLDGSGEHWTESTWILKKKKKEKRFTLDQHSKSAVDWWYKNGSNVPIARKGAGVKSIVVTKAVLSDKITQKTDHA
ncbi:hypothetical protein XANCAGTX0491_003427 [Xanthoria calcicola]